MRRVKYLLRLSVLVGLRPTEIEYICPTFKQAYDLLRTDLQLLRDFGRGKVFRQCGEACR
jgi:hypothetical protein